MMTDDDDEDDNDDDDDLDDYDDSLKCCTFCKVRLCKRVGIS